MSLGCSKRDDLLGPISEKPVSERLVLLTQLIGFGDAAKKVTNSLMRHGLQHLTRIVPNYSAKFCGIIRSSPELAADERRASWMALLESFAFSWEMFVGDVP